MAFKDLSKLNSVEYLYCDAGVMSDGGRVRSRSVVGGVWAFCGVRATGERVIECGGFVPAPQGRSVTNQIMELIAICKAMEYMPCGWEGAVGSDCETALGRVFLGWSMAKVPVTMEGRIDAARSLLGHHVYPLLCKGHPRREMLMSGQAWRYEVPCEKPKRVDNFLGRTEDPWCTMYSHEALPAATLTLSQAKRFTASVFHVSHHQAWCDDECKRQATKARDESVF